MYRLSMDLRKNIINCTTFMSFICIALNAYTAHYIYIIYPAKLTTPSCVYISHRCDIINERC